MFSYVAAGSDGSKKSPHMQQRHASHHPQQTPKAPQTQHLPQQASPKLQTIISKPNQSPPSQPKPVQVPLKQAGQPVPVKSEAVQPPTKLPAIPARRTSVPSTSPPSSEPPKIKPPQLSEAAKRAQSVTVTSTRGTPPPIPARSGSVSYSQPPSQQQQIRPVRRQQTLNSAMPPVIPQAAPEFYIPQRRGSITRQQSSTSSATSSPKTTK